MQIGKGPAVLHFITNTSMRILPDTLALLRASYCNANGQHPRYSLCWIWHHSLMSTKAPRYIMTTDQPRNFWRLN